MTSQFILGPRSTIRRPSHPATAARRQRGVVLFIALIVLVAMTLAGIAMVRSVDTTTQVTGNLTFQQGAIQSSDAGVEAARQWLLAQVGTSNLNQDSPSNKAAGYFSTWQSGLDLTGTQSTATTDDVAWTGTCHSFNAACAAQVNGGAPDDANNTVSYVIHRMCSKPLPINNPTNTCASTTVSANGSTMDAVTYNDGPIQNGNAVYYRVTVRTLGPKNTMTYTQTMIVL
jgi:type IV pilus assembly protein PilX